VLLPTVAISTALGHLVMHAASLALEAREVDETSGGSGGGGSGGGGSGSCSGGSGGGGGLAFGRRRKASLASSLLGGEGGEAVDAGRLVDARLTAAPVNTTVRGDGHA
tara:strand:- start:230 stop:553 length:324 start_codon:yes stop_codon:yes gene_type:complete